MESKSAAGSKRRCDRPGDATLESLAIFQLVTRAERHPHRTGRSDVRGVDYMLGNTVARVLAGASVFGIVGALHAIPTPAGIRVGELGGPSSRRRCQT